MHVSRPFSKNLHFWGCVILSHPALIQSIQFLQWYFECIRFKFLTELFFLVTTVVMITEKLPFSYFHGNHCQGNRCLHENNAAYQSKLSLKKYRQTDKESSRRVVIKVHILFPIVMTETAATGSKHIKSYFSGFLNNLCLISKWTSLIFKNSLFSKSPWCLIWTFCTQTLKVF